MIPPADAYALARALAQQPPVDLPLSPWAAALLRHNDFRNGAGAQLAEILGPDIMAAILAQNPLGPPPVAANRHPDTAPPTIQAETAPYGGWLRDYIHWAGTLANQTPLDFHEAVGLFLASLAIARRLYIRAPWGQDIYPNLYLMLVAESTYYRKTTATVLGQRILAAAIPHMLMPNPGSPEGFLQMLAGKEVSPEGADSKTVQRIMAGNKFAGQRGILRDEISGLFKASRKDYMAGLTEAIMEMYDCPPYRDVYTSGAGLTVINQPGPSMLGLTTPAELGATVSDRDFRNGLLARFALITPERDYHERERARQPNVGPVMNALNLLHHALPTPDDGLQVHKLAVDDLVIDEIERYGEALRQQTAPDTAIDDRLRPLYGRMHVQAAKVAIILAALDWAGNKQAPPLLTLAHWHQAIGIAEKWRLSAHRLLDHLSADEESQIAERIERILRGNATGESLYSLYRSLRKSRDTVEKVVTGMVKDGRLMMIPKPEGIGGPPVPYYVVPESG